MDPLSTVASSKSLVRAIYETYTTIHAIKGRPKAFDRVNKSLQLIQLALWKIQTHRSGPSADALLANAIRPFTRRCEQKIRVLYDIFVNLKHGLGSDSWQRQTWADLGQNRRSVLLELAEGNKVEALMQEILADLVIVDQYQTFGVATESQVAQLQRRMEELSTTKSVTADAVAAAPKPLIAGGGTGYQNHQGNSGTGHQAVDEDATKRQAIKKTLHTTPYKDDKNRSPFPVPGTCKWFVGHTLFRQWCNSSESTILWASADPGAGKSVLARHLVDTILPRELGSSLICYFFFKDEDDGKRSAKSALRCMLHQVFEQREELLSDRIVNRFGGGGGYETNSLADTWDIFTQTLSQRLPGEDHISVVCVIDALDECDGSEQADFMGLLCNYYQQIGQDSRFSIKMLITSRPYSSIRKGLHPLESNGLSLIHLRGETDEEIEKIKQEIDLVIQAEVDQLQSYFQLEDSEKEALLAGLQKFDNRTYLWVHLTLDVIKAQFDEDMDLAIIASSLPPSVDAAYERMLSSSPDKEKAKRLLHFLVAALRPLTVEELNFALALLPHHRNYDEVVMIPEARFREHIRELCGLLVTVIDSKVYLLHQTVKEFLVWDKDIDSEEASSTHGPRLVWKYSLHGQESQQIIANACMRSLHLHDTEEMLSSAKSTTNTFLLYSAHYWVNHFLASETKASDAALALVSMRHAPKCPAAWFMVYFFHFETKYPLGFTRLMVASYCGLEQIVKRLLRHPSADLNAKDSVGRSALSWTSNMACDQLSFETLHGQVDGFARETMVAAAGTRYATVARLLIDAGAEVDSMDVHNLTPFYYAIKHGCSITARLLLQFGANVNTLGSSGETPVDVATTRSEEATVRWLLEAGADIMIHDRTRRSLFRWSVLTGEESLVQMLLDAGTDVAIANIPDEIGVSPLDIAIIEGRNSVIQMLLDAGLDTNLLDGLGSTSLHTAILHGQDSIIRMLLDAGADPNLVDNLGSSPLATAIHDSQDSVIQMLLDAGANPNMTDESDESPLNCAIAEDRVSIVRMLLDAGADPNAAGELNRSPLEVAACDGRISAMQILLDAGADPNSKESTGLSHLTTAVLHDRESVLRVLLDAGVDPNVSDMTGLTLLELAALRGQESVVRILLDAGADPNASDGQQMRSLGAAVSQDRESVVRMLLDAGADVTLYGEGLLLLAKSRGQDSIVRMLTEAGVDAELDDVDGVNLPQIARS
ncbi:ankyrin repeat-containing protein [Sporothrix schenckii 1099-18]|uniref:Ankyrin repeat-containing protein n=1 Tax=Sporothrix schenckii 1099-18 TaxID=1397361 RepID=A0A0F2LXG8_SPOSC|nr:ankyrin repeat-containing protein [Sporothrix schenckii 1099-18]KJR82158.1 ankyrin repeat-containing protein [Sporothrix schenckii 1099-18]